MTATGSRDGAEVLREAAQLMREQHGPEHKRHTMWAAIADSLDSVATRHCDDGTEELVLHPDTPCQVCEEQGGHEIRVCGGCYPTWDGEQARAVWPCVEFSYAFAIATAYLTPQESP